MRLAVMALMVVLAGCTTPQEPQTVKVEVVKPCIKEAPKRPAYQTGKGAYPGEKAAAAILAADFEKAEQYGTAWEAAAAGCIIPQ